MAQRKDSFFTMPKSGKAELKKFKKLDQNVNTPQGMKQDDNKRKMNEKFGKKNENAKKGDEKEKKPFDKKTYRFKKYSNKYKLEKWEDQRKKKLLRHYYKEVKNEKPIGSYKLTNTDETDQSSIGKFVRHPDLIESQKEAEKPLNSKTVKKDAFWRAKEEFGRLKQSKVDKKTEIEQKKKEREEKLMEYQKKKMEVFKKLNKKTRKGQPVMTGRLELLLEKIEQSK